MSLKFEDLKHLEKLAENVPATLQRAAQARQLHKIASAHYAVPDINEQTVALIIGTKLAHRLRERREIESGVRALASLK